MTYRIQVDQNGRGVGIWRFEQDVAVKLGVSGDSANWSPRDGLSVLDTMKRYASVWFDEPAGFRDLPIEPGQYFPRMARPGGNTPEDPVGGNPAETSDANFIAISIGQLSFLTAQLARICQTVHPVPETYSAYGHEIRNLLILACTEVESHWRGIMIANGYDKGKGQWATKHYVKLKDAMRLGDYAVAFPQFPWLAPVAPFLNWGATANSTADLAWYAAYNGVKHNREGEFERGTLERAFEAVSACAIMLCAQFGLFATIGRNEELRRFFEIICLPEWSVTETYLTPFDRPNWEPINYLFS